MKKLAVILFSILLLIAICLCTFSGLPLEVKKDKDYLYDWLLENGELMDGIDLMYKDGNFTLRTDHSRKMFVDYTIPDYDGYEVKVQLPLFNESEKITATISVHNNDSSSTVLCYHSPKNFTMKTPLEYDTTYVYPDYGYIIMSDYGTTVYEDGKYVFHLDEDKREEYEKKKQYNAEINAQRELREKIAKEVSHKSISEILDWLNEEIAEMNISDFGYKSYK